MTTIQLEANVLLVDDKCKSVSHLVAMLKEYGCKVLQSESALDAVNKASTEILDLILLDVNLDAVNRDDRSGIELARRLCMGSGEPHPICPEAMAAFISRPGVMDVTTVLSMFNLSFSGPLSRLRLAEAYADKDDTEAVKKIVVHLLSKRGFAGPQLTPRIVMEDSSYAHLVTEMRLKFAGVANIEAQMMRIIQELCLSGYYQRIKKILLSEVSKGRSRSLVMSASSEHAGGSNEMRILKVGARASIELELNNYHDNVPLLLHAGDYPAMAAHCASRDLAGLAYVELGSGRGIPDSFGDLFVTMSLENRKQLLDQLLHDSICDSTGPRIAATTPFLRRYRERFQNLQVSSQLHETARNMIKRGRLFKLEEKGDRMAIKFPEDWVVSFCNPCVAVTSDLQQILSSSYMEAIVHGDFHPDNILVDSRVRPFLIDFTHTARHHAGLDYIVMDAMLRSQVVRSVLNKAWSSDLGLANVWELGRSWLLVEYWVSLEKWSAAEEVAKNAIFAANELVEVVQLIRWLRSAARAHLCTEDVGFYAVGFGLVCYSFLGLPDPGEAHQVTREILLACAALSFDTSLRSGLGDAWLTANLEITLLDERLSECSRSWRGLVIQRARGALRLIGTPAMSHNGFEVISDDILSSCPLLSQSIFGFIEELPSEMRACINGHESIAVAILTKEFLNVLVKAGCEHHVVIQGLDYLESRLGHLWASRKTGAD